MALREELGTIFDSVAGNSNEVTQHSRSTNTEELIIKSKETQTSEAVHVRAESRE